MNLRRIADGVIFQAVLTGSLSFSHIHDLAAAHGQAGWKAWLYPLSVDLLTVAAYRKLINARRVETPTGLAWCAFLLGLGASLAANIAAVWQNPDRFVAVALGVWPAVAFLVCTLLSHEPIPAEKAEVQTQKAPERAPEIPAPAPTPAIPAPVPQKPVNTLQEPVRVPVPPPRQTVTQPRETAIPRDGDLDPLLDAAKAVNAASIETTGRPAGVTRLRRSLRIGQLRAQALRDLLREPEFIEHANGHAVLDAG